MTKSFLGRSGLTGGYRCGELQANEKGDLTTVATGLYLVSGEDLCTHSALLCCYRRIVETTPDHVHSSRVGDDAICDDFAIGTIGTNGLDAHCVSRPIDGSDAPKNDVKDEFDLVEALDDGDLFDPRFPYHAMSWLVNASNSCCWVDVFEKGNALDGIEGGGILWVVLVGEALDAGHGPQLVKVIWRCIHARHPSTPSLLSRFFPTVRSVVGRKCVACGQVIDRHSDGRI